MKTITVYEGATEPLEDTLVNSAGAQVTLDGTYLMEFMVVREGENDVIFFKSSAQSNQINFDVPSEGHYQIFRTPEDTTGKAGNHVYVLTVKKNNSIFHVEQGSFIIKGVNIP